jgi:alanine racemase
VSLEALRGNLRLLRGRLPRDVAAAAVVKSDAYGHGLVSVARVAVEEGCRFLVVSCLREVRRLRHEGITTDALIIGPILPDEAADVVAEGAVVALGSMEVALALDAEARRQGRRARVHLKLDTGMGRFGFLTQPDLLAATVARLRALPGLDIEGAATHFSESDEPESDYTAEQGRVFRLALRVLESQGVHPQWIHAANSGGVVHFPQMAFSMVRLGLAMYGICPGPEPGNGICLEPVMSAMCRVADLRDVPSGFPVSYGRTFVTKRSSRLALLPVGYGDGYPRHASGRAHVMVRGELVPLLGRVTMNFVVVDVTDLRDVAVGDTALLFGCAGADRLPARDLATAASTIPYELFCNMGRSLPSVVHEDGATVVHPARHGGG